MNTYFDPEVIAEALAAGQSQEDIAAAMTKALNDAVAVRNTQLAKEKAEKEATVKTAEANLKVAMRNWLKAVMPAEVMNTLNEDAWENLDEVLEQSMAEVKTLMQQIVTLIPLLDQLDSKENRAKPPLQTKSTPTCKKGVNPDPVSILTAFLEDNKLL